MVVCPQDLFSREAMPELLMGGHIYQLPARGSLDLSVCVQGELCEKDQR